MYISNRDFVTIFGAEGASIVISIPHDGLMKCGFEGIFPKISSNRKGRDEFVIPIVRDINTPKPVATVVWGLLPRIFCDYNRSLVDSGAAQQGRTGSWVFDFHEAYHNAITTHLRHAKERQKRHPVLLLDFHGYSSDSIDHDVILGTHSPHGPTCDQGVLEQLFTSLRDAQLTVHIAARGEPYSGQYTIWRHGSGIGVDAIQVEVARRFRKVGAETEGKQLSLAFRKVLKLISEGI